MYSTVSTTLRVGERDCRRYDASIDDIRALNPVDDAVVTQFVPSTSPAKKGATLDSSREM